MGDDAVHDDVLDTLTQWGVGALGEKLGIEFISADRERVVATMPVEGNTQPFGLLHGGASAVLAESLGSIHGTLLVAPESVVVGIDLNCTHHRSVTSGHVRGESLVLSAGRTVICMEIRIVDDADRPVCTARLTCLVRPVAK
ncbi:MAG: hotdog fold thioesterase [Candidatus Nanopelagicales bacterium]|nr:hotdog fold thioesterase [Candidatus Nanopelagicales bacterium]MCH1405040.1 hotdog fold thioesterase [Candidatus Nanopelagicales bacterium]MCH1463688.1 hotdog fold thioesterase [Candidatus Nanopelagicales bacterium]MCH9678868.1 hotdog fold thioesterase [Actinomycetes bacterium]NKB93087.1 hotdog fold thioesterase [Candidatus Nanopelagicales bacterium]